VYSMADRQTRTLMQNDRGNICVLTMCECKSDTSSNYNELLAILVSEIYITTSIFTHKIEPWLQVDVVVAHCCIGGKRR